MAQKVVNNLIFVVKFRLRNFKTYIYYKNINCKNII